MTFRSKARRAGWLLLVAAFAFGIVSAIRPSSAEAAYGLIGTRSIQMSSSEPGATNVIYKVSFITKTTATLGSILIRICANNPIIGDGCTYPTSPAFGFDWNKASLSINNITSTGAGTNHATSWNVSSSSTSNYLLLTRATPNQIDTNETITFELGNGSTNGVTNPSISYVNTTFFSRIMLFTTTTPTIGSTGNPGVTTDDYSTGSNKAYDAGGVALAVPSVLNVTAKVQEALFFCVYTNANCGAGGSAVNLGDSNNVLAATNISYTDATPKFQLSSNALNGVAVRLKGDTLTSGTFTITAIGNSCTADSTATNVEQFGVRVVTYGTGQYFGGATTLNQTPDGSANDFSCNANFHKFDPTLTNTTYGQPFVRTIGATDVSETNFELEAKAANTTEAGVYTTKLQLIATATY